MNYLKLLTFFTFVIVLYSCSSSKVVLSHGIDISKYSYVIFGEEGKGIGHFHDADVIMKVRNAIAMTKLTPIHKDEIFAKIVRGESVLTPNIHVSSYGSKTTITVSFYDVEKETMILVLKGSSGSGFSISHNQDLAIKAISKKLKEIFGDELVY